MRVFSSIVTTAFAFSTAVSADAQSNISPGVAQRSPTAIVKYVTESDLKAVVLAEGHTVDSMHPFEQPSVRGKTKEGVLFVLVGTACNTKGVPGCQGIMMQVRYDADEKVTLEGMNSANMAQAAVSSWWDKSEKTIGFTRYVVLDDGVTWMNVRQNLRVLLSIQAQAVKKVWPE